MSTEEASRSTFIPLDTLNAAHFGCDTLETMLMKPSPKCWQAPKALIGGGS
jgi:hypothetical protein